MQTYACNSKSCLEVADFNHVYTVCKSVHAMTAAVGRAAAVLSHRKDCRQLRNAGQQSSRAGHALQIHGRVHKYTRYPFTCCLDALPNSDLAGEAVLRVRCIIAVSYSGGVHQNCKAQSSSLGAELTFARHRTACL